MIMLTPSPGTGNSQSWTTSLSGGDQWTGSQHIVKKKLRIIIIYIRYNNPSILHHTQLLREPTPSHQQPQPLSPPVLPTKVFIVVIIVVIIVSKIYIISVATEMVFWSERMCLISNEYSQNQDKQTNKHWTTKRSNVTFFSQNLHQRLRNPPSRPGQEDKN